MQSFGVPPRAQYRFGGSDVRHMHEYFDGAVHVEYTSKPLAKSVEGMRKAGLQ